MVVLISRVIRLLLLSDLPDRITKLRPEKGVRVAEKEMPVESHVDEVESAPTRGRDDAVSPVRQTVVRRSMFERAATLPHGKDDRPHSDAEPPSRMPQPAESTDSLALSDLKDVPTQAIAPEAAYTRENTGILPGVALDEELEETEVSKGHTVGAGKDSQIDEYGQEEAVPAKRTRHKVAFLACAVVALLAVVYVGAAFLLSNRVPAGTEIAGVDVSGMSREDARAALVSLLSPRASEPVTVSVGEKEATVDPTVFSLKVDEKATIDSLVGFSFNPVRLWAHISGGRNLAPVLSVDEEALRAEIAKLATILNTEPVDASVAFSASDPANVSVNATQAAEGMSVDTEAAYKELSTNILSATQPIRLAATATAPAITDDIAAKAVEQGTILISDKVSVMVGEKLVELTPAQLASVASFTPEGSTLTLALTPQALADMVRAGASDVLKPGVDARVEIVDHTTPTVIPSEDGVGIDEADLAAKVLTAATSTNRTASITPIAIPAAFTTADAQALGIKEVVSEIKTPLTSDSVRTQNLLVGTKLVANTLVKPGETFSLSEKLGDISPERGFTSSGVVTNGFNSTALGGGLSQLSTNTFNVGYLAGMVDVEHKPHSKHFSRYPTGREATLWTGQIDMKWKNNTPYGAIIDAWVEGGYVHTKLWSTKYWDVTTTTSAPYNYVQPTTRHNPAADCEPMRAGEAGFTVRVQRTVSHEGVVDPETTGGYTWTYQPVDAVVCN